MRKLLLLIFAILLPGCSLFSGTHPIPTVVAPTATNIPATITPTPTLEPFGEYTIDYLRRRTYGGGRIEVIETLLETDVFTSYSIRYPSDGLVIQGFVDVPKGDGPFPVIVSIHAYSQYGGYNAFDPYADFADFFAANGFIVLHPGLRNHPPSDNGDNLLRVGMSVDVLNLIALAKAGDQWPSELPPADTHSLGLWGMSLGGEIALRVLTVDSAIKATVLYSSLTGDIERNSKQLYAQLADKQFQHDLEIPPAMFERISPVHYYDKVKSAVQIHHGMEDTIVPVGWATETCDLLRAAGVSVECLYYTAGHIFNRPDVETMQQRALEFYRIFLAP